MDESYRPLKELIGAGWSEETVIANDIAQHFFRTGAGRRPAVVLLHGFMESGISWLRVARELANEYDVIMPDARAHGRSADPESGFAPEILADDVVALLQMLELEPSVLVGRSNGTVTAALVAAAHPNLVRGLVLEEPPAGGMPRPAIRQERVQGQNWFQEWMQWMQSLPRLSHEERMASAFARWPRGLPVPPDEPVWPEDDFVSHVEALAHFNTRIFEQEVGYWSLLPYLEQAAGVTCPALLVAGDPQLGSMVPEETGRELAASWPRGQFVRIAGAGHLVSRGRTYKSYMQLLQSFLNQLK